MKIKILVIIVSIAACIATASYILYTFYYSSNAEGQTRSIDFGTSNSSGDYFMNELVVGLTNLEDTALIDGFLSTFSNLPVFVRLVNPAASVVDGANFARIQSAGHFWYFSAPTYTDLRAIAQSYYTKFPNGRIILELTNHESRSDTETQSLASSFPKAKIVAANYVNWNREKAKELINTSMPNHLTNPSLHAVSFHIDATGGLSNVAENVALFWDTIWDASTDTPGTSIKVEWPTKAYFLSLSEIKTIPRTGTDLIKDEARRLGVLITVYYNYPQMRGDDTRLNNNIPIRYSGLGDFGSLSASAKSIAAVFAHISKHKMAGVYPEPQTGFNYRFQQKPFYGVGGYSQNVGYAFVFANTSEDTWTLQFPSSFPGTQYSIVSTTKGSQSSVSTNNQIVFEPYEVVAIYKTGSLSIAPAASGTPQATITPSVSITTTPSPPVSTSPTTTATPTKTLSPAASNTPTATLTPTQTPTITVSLTPTITKTPTPTPIIAAFCASAECGVCGWKDTSGVCHSRGPMPDGKTCCFSTCISSSCRYVSGFGTDKCIDDSACGAAPIATYSAASKTNLTPHITYIVIEPSASKKQDSNPNKITQSANPTKTNSITTNISQGISPTPPVSGDSKPIFLFVIPAVIIILGAIAL